MNSTFLRNLTKRMPSVEFIQSLSQRANEADAVFEYLRSKISTIKASVQNNVFKEETSRLSKENETLLYEIEILKNRLNKLENENGNLPVLKVESTSVVKEEVKTEVKIDSKRNKTGTTNEKNEIKNQKPAKEKKEKSPKKSAEKEIPVDIRRLDLRVGKILSVKKHPDADSLYVEQVDVGEESPRTVVSGLVKFIPLEEMVDRLAVLMCNLKPAKMRGIVSQAMVMCASTPEKVEILSPPEDSTPGEFIEFEGYPSGVADAQLNPKKKIWEQVSPDLKTNNDLVATYKGIPFSVSGKGVVRAQTLANVIIK